MTPKRYVLMLLAAIAFSIPLLDVVITGRVRAGGVFAVAEALISLTIVYWWYHLDKREMKYQASAFLNVGVAALMVVALPIYFVRSRGWKFGAISTLLAIVTIGVLALFGIAGESIGRAIAS